MTEATDGEISEITLDMKVVVSDFEIQPEEFKLV